MSTSQPISTISYNTEPYLRGVLETLIQSHTISDYIYIPHKADNDDTKDHTHVWIQPNKSLDPMAIKQMLIEPDPNNPEHPLGCINFRRSKVDDFILYTLHLQPYLESKGLTRNIHYSASDFRYHNEDDFRYLLNHALAESDYVLKARALDMIFRDNANPTSVIRAGLLPLNSATSIRALKLMEEDYYIHNPHYINKLKIKQKEGTTENEQ